MRHDTPPTRSHAAGFTLAELLVAIGAVAILTVGVGRIFGSINTLVATGIAVAEIDQIARTIEQRMREDLQALGQMNPDETYIAIRMVELGHPDRPIYLTPEDRQFDILAGVSPYDPGSRAVYRRLDDIVFIAGGQAGSRSFASAQPDGFYTTAVPTSEHARIYWGHALKPKPNRDWPDPDPAKRFPENPDAPRVPPRLFEPDGYFGDPPANDDPSPLSDTEGIFGRNEYAADWTLARHALLLLGPNASGENERKEGPFPLMAGASGTRQTGAGGEREYAPYIRDIETLARVWPGLDHDGEFSSFGNTEIWPDPRLIRHGRVDIVAQSLEGVRRFLEGEPHEDDAGAPAGDPAAVGWPFEPGVGRLGRDGITGAGDPFGEFADNLEIQQPLWRWRKLVTSAAVSRVEAWNNYQDSLKNIRSALAGTIIRPLVEIEPPALDRVLDEAPDDDEDGPENAIMDNHAVIGPRCSSFEIAWTDGTTAIEVIDLDSDGVLEYLKGDLLWWDIRRVDPTEENDDRARRATLAATVQFASLKVRWSQSSPPSRESNATAVFDPWMSPELLPIEQDRKLNRFDGTETGVVTNPREAIYNPDLTGGVPSWIDSPDAKELLVIFPFRDTKKAPPLITTTVDRRIGVGFGEDSEPWVKPRFIRVRMTLHDSNNRVEGGKQFEFIFPIDLRD